MVAIAAMMICLGASAIDKVFKKATLSGEVTSVEGLKSSKFLLANGEGDALVILYTPSGWDIKVENPGIAADKSDNGGLFQLTELDTHYLIPVFNFDGNRRTFWAGKQSVNAQPTGNVIFGLDGDNAQHGQDGANLAVWDVAYEEGKGFTFHCVGRDIYISHANGAACPSATAVYWKAYTEWALAYDVAGVEAAGTAVANALKASDAKTTFDAAKLAYETDKTAEGAIDKYAAAINAAIDVVNACDVVKAAFAGYKLSTLGTAAVKEVETKYNAGEYKDVAELSAAYVAAVKTQNAVGSDFTGAIVNPSFELGNANGWTYEASDDHGAKENSNGTYTMSNNDGKYVFNIWSKGNAISQTIEGLPNGTYKLQAVIATDGGQKVQLNANDKNVQIDATDKGTGVEGEVEFEVTDGKATIGAEGVNKYWYKVDNFRLTLVNPANATVPEKDAWYTGADFFRFRADKNATEGSPYFAWKDKVEPVWGAAAGEETNGCIVCKVPANVNPQSQIWIRGTEAGKTVANGSKDGFRVTFRVKADGEYTLESQAHNNWGYKTGKDPFGPLNVTTEWQTVSFVCTGEKAKNDFTDLCFNLSGDAERTIYFDDVQIVRGSEWYLNNEFHAKDYQDPTATYSDGQNPHPAARFVSDAEGGYVEVISNAGGNQTYNSQLWIAIPAEYVGKSTKMTMEVQASKAIKTPESFQATATGNGWGCNPGPGAGLEFSVGKWTTITRILKTEGVKSTGTWKDLQADQYCLDLTEKLDGNAGEAITYKFRNVKFEQAAEDWYEQNVIVAKDPAVDYEDGKEYDFPAAPYVFGTGEEGGYIEVKSKANPANEWASQIFFEIPAALRNGQVELVMTVKASKAVKANGQLHKSNNGGGYTNAAAPAAEFTTDWNEISLIIDPTTQEGLSNYVLNIALDAEGVTYDFDKVAFKKYVAPVDPSSYEEWYTALGEQGIALVTRGEFGREGDNPAIYTKGEGAEGDYIEVTANTSGDRYASQLFVKLTDEAIPTGTKVKLTMKVKASEAAKVGTQAHNGIGNFAGWNTFGEYEFTTDWTDLTLDYTVGTTEFTTIAFDLCYSATASTRSFFFDNIKVELVAPVDPTTLDWSENIMKNGDLTGDDMSEFILKNNDVENPEMLPAEKNEIGEIGIETKALPTEGGNDYDAQFFIRLPKVLPKGTYFSLAFDLYAEQPNTLVIGGHAEPGQWKANLSEVKLETGGDGITHYQEYLTTPEDIRTIAVNLAVATDATYGFSNVCVKVVKDDEAAIEAATTAADAKSLWAETLALNEACYAGRTTETEGKGYSEDLVKALTDAIAAGKAELKKAENASEDVTAATLTAAAKAITDAIAALAPKEAKVADLTADMYHKWTGVDGSAAIADPDDANCDYVLDSETGCAYGNSNINIGTSTQYADLGEWDYLTIVVASDNPRLFFNQNDVADQGGNILVPVTDANYVVSNENGVIVYDLAKFKADKGFVHLNAIKASAYNTQVNITEMKLATVEPYKPVATAIEGVENAEDAVKDGKYFINGQIVIVKNGVKYNAAGVAIK